MAAVAVRARAALRVDRWCVVRPGAAAGARASQWPLQRVEAPLPVEVTVRHQPGRYVVHLVAGRGGLQSVGGG